MGLSERQVAGGRPRQGTCARGVRDHTRPTDRLSRRPLSSVGVCAAWVGPAVAGSVFHGAGLREGGRDRGSAARWWRGQPTWYHQGMRVRGPLAYLWHRTVAPTDLNQRGARGRGAREGVRGRGGRRAGGRRQRPDHLSLSSTLSLARPQKSRHRRAESHASLGGPIRCRAESHASLGGPIRCDRPRAHRRAGILRERCRRNALAPARAHYRHSRAAVVRPAAGCTAHLCQAARPRPLRDATADSAVRAALGPLAAPVRLVTSLHRGGECTL